MWSVAGPCSSCSKMLDKGKGDPLCSKCEGIGCIQVLCSNHCGPYEGNGKDPSPRPALSIDTLK